jgi:hypothetical protein
MGVLLECAVECRGVAITAAALAHELGADAQNRTDY